MSGSAPAYIPVDLSALSELNFTAKTDTYTIDPQDCVINCTANTFTVTLPTAVGSTGRFYVIKNSGTGVITIEGDGAETIDGVPNKVLSVQYESMTVISDGSNWAVI